MSMIKIENLTFSYPASCDNVFENVCFQMDTDWKLGLIGRNGRGKTTLLKLLLGKYEYSGNISASVQFDYFPYFVHDKTRLVAQVLFEVCPSAEKWEFIRELSYLDMDGNVLWKPFEILSNGEQTKVLLAALFLSKGHFLLIDEPTNHLDLNARKKVSEYLKKKKGFILVSHDRYFLDGCVDHILSFNKTNIEVQSGNFSSWNANFSQQQESEQAQNERLQKEVKRLKQAAKRSADWSDITEASKYGAGPVDRGYIGHKSAKMMKRSKSIETRRQQAIDEKSKLLKNAETAESLKLYSLPYNKHTLVSFSDVTIYYKDTKICNPVSFTINSGERVALEGKNGSGKSSLLKLLLGEPVAHTGTVSVGSGLVVSYVLQDTSHLNGLFKDFIRQHHLNESLFKSILRKMDFERTQFEKNIADLSDGQKKKVLLAKSLCEQANLYVWDEPLNFIDIYSRMQIEQLIKEFSPTMIFVEHDKSFRDAAATKIITI